MEGEQTVLAHATFKSITFTIADDGRASYNLIGIVHVSEFAYSYYNYMNTY